MADFTDNEKLASLYVSSGKTQDSRVGGAEWLRKMALHIFNNSTSAKGTYSGVSEKLAPVDDDVLLVEDSESEFVKKRVKLGNLPGGGGGLTQAQILARTFAKC